jgi:SSS family solute:Na+ symporter
VHALRLNVNALDYVLLATYFAAVLGIGWVVRTSVRTTEDFFLSGRPLPAWVTGLAFVSANLGATEVLGQAANGAEYGTMTVHYYWVGAVPAMVFLAVFMMPFYYGFLLWEIARPLPGPPAHRRLPRHLRLGAR